MMEDVYKVVEIKEAEGQHFSPKRLLGCIKLHGVTYVVGSKSFRPDQLFKVTEIKQICYFST